MACLPGPFLCGALIGFAWLSGEEGLGQTQGREPGPAGASGLLTHQPTSSWAAQFRTAAEGTWRAGWTGDRGQWACRRLHAGAMVYPQPQDFTFCLPAKHALIRGTVQALLPTKTCWAMGLTFLP